MLILIHNAFAATQDVAIDALAVNVLREDERGLANGLMFGGAYLGQAIGGSGVLFLTPVHRIPADVLLRRRPASCSVTLFVALPLREPTGPPRAPVDGSRLRRGRAARSSRFVRGLVPRLRRHARRVRRRAVRAAARRRLRARARAAVEPRGRAGPERHAGRGAQPVVDGHLGARLRRRRLAVGPLRPPPHARALPRRDGDPDRCGSRGSCSSAGWIMPVDADAAEPPGAVGRAGRDVLGARCSPTPCSRA